MQRKWQIKKVSQNGKIIDAALYSKIQKLDFKIFEGCGNEFLNNRAWWAVVIKNKIIGYCGCIYSEGICIFNRAWVMKDYRGQGIQRAMIVARLRSARKCSIAITYTTATNYASANNLIHCKFKLYGPAYAYAGKEMLYFRKKL